MDFSPEVSRNLVWAAVSVLGAVLAIADRRWLGRWIFGPLLLAVIAAGSLVTVVSPFSFGGTSYYMHGVIIAGGAALALAGYGIALVVMQACRYMGRKRH